MVTAEMTPAERMLDMSYTTLVTQRALYVAAKLGIADLVGADSKSSDELARKTDTNPRAMYRLLRALANAGIFTESPGQRFGLTALGGTLRMDASPSIRRWVLFAGAPFYLQVWQNLEYSIRSGLPAFEQAHGSPFFDWLGQHPDEASIFDAAMTSLSGGEAPAAADAYDFSDSQMVVDVGGGHGALVVAILRANPHLRATVYDQPQVIEGARQRIAAEGLAARCDLLAGDFFQAVPPGGDLYVLKYIIHDWDDEHSIRILTNCRKVMPANGRLLLVETVIPPADQPHFAKVSDLEMLVLLGSQERTEAEYGELLDRAGFSLNRVIPTREYLSIVEALPV